MLSDSRMCVILVGLFSKGNVSFCFVKELSCEPGFYMEV